MNKHLKEPLNMAGFILVVTSFVIHMSVIIGYGIPDWLTITAAAMYPIGFALFIIAGKKSK